MTLPDRFVKMSGGGNDFLLFEADGRKLSDEDRRRVSLLCRRGLSVGADGALFVSGGEEGRVHLDYFNADGGLADFCANGTRCAARYAVTRRLVAGDAAVLETGFGPIPAQVEEDRVTLTLPALTPPGDAVAVSGEGLPATATPMHVGVPHLVVILDDEGDLSRLSVERLGPPLRRHPLMPHGANVNFVKIEASDRLAVRTFERGVEAETLACGSGIVASAVVAARAGLVSSPVLCRTRSGVEFVVALPERDLPLKGVTLTGDAREVFSGELSREAWLE